MTVKRIFLLDGLGAVVSVLLMSLVLPYFQEWLGMPLYVLYACAIWASGCMLYSWTCYGFMNLDESKWLFGIMLANTLYCVFTALLIAVHFNALTTIGLVYFIAEMPVILGLVLWERKIYRDNYGQPSSR